MHRLKKQRRKKYEKGNRWGCNTHTHTHTQVSNNKKEIDRRNDNGVTLIALVITIIILLILASVSITTLFGQDGIITKAQEAGRRTKEASENEQAFLNYAEDYLNNYLNGTPKTIAEKMADAGITGNAESLEDVIDGVPIPKGFEPSDVTGEKTKAEGLVIKDKVTGSEFVWVPVRDLTPDGYIDDTQTAEKFGRRLFGRSDSLGGKDAVTNKYTEKLPEPLTDSVRDYGGFYIARYEASYEDGKAVSKPSTTARTDMGWWTPVNGKLWNLAEYTTAKEECENMYTSEAKVVSHLPYGAEWDTTLQWFKETAFSGEVNPDALIGSDSRSWGNYWSEYSDTLANTGAGGYRRVNNIYDIAGNLWEWTQEKYGTVPLVVRRGGDYGRLRSFYLSYCW